MNRSWLPLVLQRLWGPLYNGILHTFLVANEAAVVLRDFTSKENKKSNSLSSFLPIKIYGEHGYSKSTITATATA